MSDDDEERRALGMSEQELNARFEAGSHSPTLARVPDARAVWITGDTTLLIEFVDNKLGDLDLGPFLRDITQRSDPARNIFTPMLDPHYFRKVKVRDGVLCWPNGADLAPEITYADAVMRETNQCPTCRAPASGRGLNPTPGPLRFQLCDDPFHPIHPRGK